MEGAITSYTYHICNLLYERHVHLHSILYVVYSIHGLTKDGNWMDIVIMIVVDDTSKSRTGMICLGRI